MDFIFISDLAIGSACIAASIALACLVRAVRPGALFQWAFLAFEAFLIACACSHFVAIGIAGTPPLWLSGAAKAITAIAAAATAILIPFLIPKCIASVNAAAASGRQLTELAASNADLRSEIAESQRTNGALQAQLNAQTRQLADMAEIVTHSIDAIFSRDLEGVITSWNPAAERMFGYSAAEIIGKNVSCLVPEDLQAESSANLRKLNAGEAVETFEALRRRKDGRTLSVSISPSPLRDSRGAVAGASVIARDITARKQLEDRLRQAQRLEAVGQLAGGIAHDFNNLLTVIMGYAEILAGDAKPGGARDPILEILGAARRAADLTRQLLAFSRRQVLQPQVLNLNASVAGIEKMLGRLLGENNAVTAQLAPDLWNVAADPGQIDQILINLAVNARDAMEYGGRLSIETANAYLDDAYGAEHAGVKPGEYVRLSVTDSGHGMDRATIQHVFEPFFTTKAPGVGTGLGLATVYGIVKQSGGNIWVDSEPGKGTTFHVYLPRTLESAAVPAAIAPAPRAGPETVLVVEDEAAVRKLVTVMLTKCGYAVAGAATSSEALAIVADPAARIDLLISDMVLPDLDGRQLASAANRLKPGLKVLLMSGYTEHAALRPSAFDAGAGFLQKPFTQAQLSEKVREILDREG